MPVCVSWFIYERLGEGDAGRACFTGFFVLPPKETPVRTTHKNVATARECHPSQNEHLAVRDYTNRKHVLCCQLE